MIKLSIIIPIYNTPIIKLDRCLKSIERLTEQINAQIECILVDDGSDDYIEDYYNERIQETFLKFLKKENGGASSARNYGVEHAEGQYILFVDADDIIIPEAVKDMLYRGYTADVVISDLIYVNNSKQTVWKAFPTDKEDVIIEDILKQLSINGKLNGPCCKMIRRDYLLRCNAKFPEDMITGEDAVFFYGLINPNVHIQYHREPTYIYYYELSTTKGRIRKDANKMLMNYRHVLDEYALAVERSVLSSSVRDKLLKNSVEHCIKQIFNLKLSLYRNRWQNTDIIKHIKTVTSSITQCKRYDINKVSKVTKVRLLMLKYNIKHLDFIMALLQDKYLKIKGSLS
ncbi:Glycosyl transferase, family 2 [Anaerovibrio sp. JC8]|uniref:glycosyltransferase family 2 protein n=1 Tax=Anaerovibrio sp. JC8 TaxID=1240085 RepID=UPI000A0AB675|nr:glycosyltransferase family 2 protein [Anaerovibrio sp. JC8]ORU01440.1 Glycosyl transferase, family 2 [Anaerovibrio sp. JC8]